MLDVRPSLTCVPHAWVWPASVKASPPTFFFAMTSTETDVQDKADQAWLVCYAVMQILLSVQVHEVHHHFVNGKLRPSCSRLSQEHRSKA